MNDKTENNQSSRASGENNKNNNKSKPAKRTKGWQLSRATRTAIQCMSNGFTPFSSVANQAPKSRSKFKSSPRSIVLAKSSGKPFNPPIKSILNASADGGAEAGGGGPDRPLFEEGMLGLEDAVAGRDGMFPFEVCDGDGALAAEV